MNLPNKLTMLRILLVPVFMVLAGVTQYGTASYTTNAWYLAAGIVFAVASFTDYLDGYLARKWNLVTDFGKFADPLADKLLTTVAFLYMMRDGVCSIWVVAIILAREGDCGQLVGQGENCAANGDNPVLLLCRLIGRPYRCDGRWPYQPGAVLAGGRRYADFRRQISVG